MSSLNMHTSVCEHLYLVRISLDVQIGTQNIVNPYSSVFFFVAPNGMSKHYYRLIMLLYHRFKVFILPTKTNGQMRIYLIHIYPQYIC